MNTEEFIRKSQNKHGDKYDYSKSDYINANTKILIICKEHGEFLQIPRNHFGGKGCYKCGRIKSREVSRFDIEKFINKSKRIHGDKYDYSQVSYVDCHTNVSIICREHGVFMQSPLSHWAGSKCPLCTFYNKNNRFIKLTLEEFINKSKNIHGNKYDYSEVVYVNHKTHVAIVCPVHGQFLQSPHCHLRGSGCPKCGLLKISTTLSKFTIDEYVSKASLVHGKEYSYELLNHNIILSDKLTILCDKHGAFEQTARLHIKGAKCPKCLNDKFSLNNSMGHDEFIERSKSIHGDRFNYDKVDFINQYKKVTVICKEHGAFRTIPKKHFNGSGCPRCRDSYFECQVSDFLNSKYNGTINRQDRETIGVELDFYIPEFKLAIECNGLYYHSFGEPETNKQRLRHYSKTELALINNIKLLHIFENEWNDKNEIVKSMILNNLQINEKIHGRKCIVKTISNKLSNEFVDNNHIQGHRNASLNYGLYHDGKLHSVMSFSQHHKYEWEIIRFCTALNYTVIGGASKIFNKFIDDINPSSILSYADRRYSIGSLYEKLGFKLQSITKPNYYYVKGNKLYNRQMFQKHKLNNKLNIFDDSLSESENMFNNGYRRIWNSGNYKYVWNK